MRHIVPVGGIADKLGRLMHDGYTMWDWRYNLENGRVLHLLEYKMDIYISSNLTGTQRMANHWIRSRMIQPVE